MSSNVEFPNSHHEQVGQYPQGGGLLLAGTDFKEFGEKHAGKVRDVYEQAEDILLVATDRYSAFDRNLALVPHKGELVTQISRLWFDETTQIIDNHAIEYPDPNVTVAKKCQVIPVEMVVRQFITGVTNTSLWNMYDRGKRDFDNFILPDGLRKNQQLESPVITPTTKLEKEHDRPLSLDGIVQEGLVSAETRDRLVSISLELFGFGQRFARERGLILVDTKYEFGLTNDGRIILIDELHTPDSSRYWRVDNYSERFDQGQEPDYYDKEFLRLWYQANSKPYLDEVMPEAPTDMILEMTRRYIYVFEKLTGQTFRPDLETPILSRIEQNLRNYSL